MCLAHMLSYATNATTLPYVLLDRAFRNEYLSFFAYLSPFKFQKQGKKRDGEVLQQFMVMNVWHFSLLHTPRKKSPLFAHDVSCCLAVVVCSPMSFEHAHATITTIHTVSFLCIS